MMEAGADAGAVALCLSEAFSAGIWAETPMPVGTASDPDSAMGVISGLGRRPAILAASAPHAVAGCVLGAVLTPAIIAQYGLAPWGALPGDGLLAFIGISPGAQGSRIRACPGDLFELSRDPGDPSLAGMLFRRWLRLPALAGCPRLFFRTRHRIGAIRHLGRRCGFAECGSFEIMFRGRCQTRLVYRREHAAAPPQEGRP
ncbi:hypothetical protein [Mangrovicoccus sp. HB161399]|uniref:hypothetical protein n=1 Tax=Mangrovicoccus sp. HB161399 TaxID=2720392 RepID=UPI0015578D14|nr:hypothetical protein [Mangrovicoccus sp. HB161399]